MPQKKVNIISAQYIAENDSVFWEVETKEGDIYPLRWPRNEFGKSMGIKGAEDIAPALLVEFCQKMMGKDINLVIDNAENIEKKLK